MSNPHPHNASVELHGNAGPKYKPAVAPDFRYHTFWPRFLASFIDGLVFLPLDLLDHVAYSVLVPGILTGLWFVVRSFLFTAYCVLLHGLYGRTIGKFITRVKVVDVSGRPLSFKQALLRDSVPIVFVFIGIVEGLPNALRGINPWDKPDTSPSLPLLLASLVVLLWCVAEIFTMLLNDKRRAVHDFIAGSVVLRDEKPSDLSLWAGASYVVRGVSIIGFGEESAARKAGLLKGDVIVEYDGVGDLTTEKLSTLIGKAKPPETRTRLTFVRDGYLHFAVLPMGPFGASAMDATIEGPFKEPHYSSASS